MLLLITCRISLPFPSQIQQKTLYTQMQMTLLSRGYPPGKLLSWSIQARDMHLYVIMFPCMYRGCHEVTVPTFMFTDSADNILLAGQAKHFISTISVKEAVDLAYSVQIRPSFAAYTHWAIIPWHTYLSFSSTHLSFRRPSGGHFARRARWLSHQILQSTLQWNVWDSL